MKLKYTKEIEPKICGFGRARMFWSIKLCTPEVGISTRKILYINPNFGTKQFNRKRRTIEMVLNWVSFQPKGDLLK